jgi:hypothetical protein
VKHWKRHGKGYDVLYTVLAILSIGYNGGSSNLKNETIDRKSAGNAAARGERESSSELRLLATRVLLLIVSSESSLTYSHCQSSCHLT